MRASLCPRRFRRGAWQGRMKPEGHEAGGLARDRIGRETRQSIRNQRAGEGQAGPGKASMRNWAGLRIAQTGGYSPGMARGEPTKAIAHARAGGETAIKTFEELKLWNDMIFVDVPRHRHFVCTQCGSRNVKPNSRSPRKPSKRSSVSEAPAQGK